MTIYPTIERDAKMNIIFHEREFNGLEYQTVLRPFWFDQNMEGSVPIQRLEFKREVFEFRIDENRFSRVNAYIEFSVLAQYGFAFINDLIRDNAAWFFTYGERVTISVRN